MAHHSEQEYTHWLQELTGLSTIEAHVEADPPMEVLVVLLRENHDHAQEIFRIPTRHAFDRTLLEDALPKHLRSTSSTFRQRLELLKALQDPVLLEKCLQFFPIVGQLQSDLHASALARERVAQQPNLLSLMHETRRQLSILAFGLDDITILRIHALIGKRLQESD